MIEKINTLSSALTKFVEWGSGRYAIRTVDTYRDLIGRFIKFTEDKAVEEASIDDIVRYYRHLRDRNYHDSSIAYAMISLRQFFKYLFLRREIMWDYQLIGVPHYVANSYVAVEPGEGATMIERVQVTDFKSLRDKTLLAFLYASGLRVSELCGLKLSDLQLELRYGNIISKKNRVKRMVFWDDRAHALLGEYLPQRGEHATCPNLFISLNPVGAGGALTPRSVQRIVEAYRVRKEISPHSFRHGLGFRAVRAGIHPRMVQKILGHKHITSSQIYMDVNDPDVVAAYEKIAVVH